MPWSQFTECWVLSQIFHSPLSLSSRGSLVPLHFLPEGCFISGALLVLIKSSLKPAEVLSWDNLMLSQPQKVVSHSLREVHLVLLLGFHQRVALFSSCSRVKSFCILNRFKSFLWRTLPWCEFYLSQPLCATENQEEKTSVQPLWT